MGECVRKDAFDLGSVEGPNTFLEADMTIFPQREETIILVQIVRFLVGYLLTRAGNGQNKQQGLSGLTESDQTSEDGDATGN